LNFVYASLLRYCEAKSGLDWLAPLVGESEKILQSNSHGDLPAWRSALGDLPEAGVFLDGSGPAPVLGRKVDDPHELRAVLMKLHPWRKGPLRIGGLTIDAEWRSDLKWDRLAGALELRGQRILDVGCGNGYYGWRMLGAGAEIVIGIDPTLVYVMQWLSCRHFAGATGNWVLPLGIGRLPGGAGGFDSVFSMGVLYHRKDPLHHLRRLATLCRPGGRVILETLILEEGGKAELRPAGRYARMRNVWVIPTLDRLRDWMRSAGLREVQVVDVSRTTPKEQRSTDWMRFESLRECLDARDDRRTVEGYPAPVRAALLAKTNP
jgi:tRNA (mo5U34)-methyltransferase